MGLVLRRDRLRRLAIDVGASVCVLTGQCGLGQDFDDYGTGWVRVAQVVPGGPAKKSLNDEDIIKVNDRIVEVNGEQVAKQPLHRWVSKLKGPEGSSCVLTLGDVHAELYTCNILRGHVDQAKVPAASLVLSALCPLLFAVGLLVLRRVGADLGVRRVPG